MGSVANALASAKNALSNADKFTQSVTGKPSYTMAHKERMMSGEAKPSAPSTTGDELKAKADNVNKYVTATQ